MNVMICFPEGKGFRLDFNGICECVRMGNTKLLEEINAALAKISRMERQSIMDHAVLKAINAQ